MGETRQDLEAVLEARRELGAQSEPELIDGFLDRLERRLDERRPAAPSERSEEARRMQFIIALVSLGTGIPITAVAAGTEGLGGLIAAWGGIAAVNYFFSRQR